MKQTMRFAFSGLLSLGAVLFLHRPHPTVMPPLSAPARKPALPEAITRIAGYKTWRKVNPKAVLMLPADAMLCVSTLRTSQPPNPHLWKYVFVYVNPIGADAMIRQVHPHFPVGSVIVKEKLSQPNSKRPELLTVMIKRAKGYHPAGGDWEFVATNGAGTQVQAQGKLESCQHCHQLPPARDADHVFRAYYLPDTPQSPGEHSRRIRNGPSAFTPEPNHKGGFLISSE